ncbi:VOC family protein [Aquabacterium soli]|jgi:predicted enzyme related to lactoylglutathione lyase|uniref:VOC family protein n=1 Tax=Aquabacterium soli TaxID=2493092 RepID=A0A426V239_9BURK|nr:VOC family protein [Aquabacterium soli]RRS00931.1 VOC family protein [Aquabacterium soli]
MQLLLNIDVPDLERAHAFYSKAFGLTVCRSLGSEILELSGSAVPVFLLLKAEGSTPFEGAVAPRAYQRHWSPIHFDVVVPDLDEAIKQVSDAGAVQEQPVSTQAWGKLAVFADPFGHGFCLIQFLAKGYGEIEAMPAHGTTRGP